MDTLKHNRVFHRLVGTTITNELSQTMAMITVPLLVLAMGESATIAGFAVSCCMGSGILASIVSGAVSDRLRPDRSLRISSLGQAICFLLIFVMFATEHPSLPAFIALSSISCVLSSLSGPSEHTIIQQIVDEKEFSKANSVVQGREAAAGLLGQPLGGALLSISAPVVLSTQTLLHTIATLICPRISSSTPETEASKTPEPMTAEAEATSFITEVVEGFRFVFSHFGLRAVTIVASLINLPMAIVPLAIITHLETTGTSSFFIGIYGSSMGVGVLLGSFLASKITEHATISQLGTLTLGVLSATWATTAWSYNNLIVICILSFVAGFTLPALNAAIGSYTMLVTPSQLMGRVTAATGVPGMILMPLGALLAGILFDTVTIQPTILIATVLSIIPLALTILLPGFRTLPKLQDVPSQEQPSS